MKRLDNSDSLSGLISICHSSADEKISGGGKNIYSTRGFQSMLDGLDEEDCVEETGHFSEKKRRLNIEQVKALEKNFEVENKLEPDRKVKLAQELGLQPRQVAIWFQNRRARWKTKQLERDYGVLKSNFDSLKANFDALQNDKEALLAELKELKSKLQEENTESLNPPLIKEEILMMDSENQVLDQIKNSSSSMVGGGTVSSETTDPNQDFSNNNNNNNNDNGVLIGVSLYGDLKDGSSDSDSSAILNEDNNNNSPNNAAISSSSGVLQQQKQNCSSINWFSESNREINSMNTQKHNYQHNYGQFLKMEEHNFFGAEEPAACSLFSDDQAPTLHWYCPDQWS